MQKEATMKNSNSKMENFKDALNWFCSSDSKVPTVLCIERELIIKEIKSIPPCDDTLSFAYCQDWTNFVFHRIYANRTVHAKAQMNPSSSFSSATVASSSNISTDPNSNSFVNQPTEFACAELESYVNKDVFGDTPASLKSVQESVRALKRSFEQWIIDRRENLRVEAACKLTEPIEWPSPSLKSDSLLPDYKKHRQLLRTIAISKRGYTISRNDAIHLSGLFNDDDDGDKHSELPSCFHSHESSSIRKNKNENSMFEAAISPEMSTKQMVFADLEKCRLELNESLEKTNLKFYQLANETISPLWKPVYKIIEFLDERMAELDSIIGEEKVDEALGELCVHHGMDVFLPFETYWFPIQEILKRELKLHPEQLDAEIGSALAKYFRFYRDVTDNTDGIPDLLKRTISQLMNFIRRFMSSYADILKNIALSNRPEITEKIINESVLSFEGLTKVTEGMFQANSPKHENIFIEGRIEELALDMDEKKAKILDEIVSFIDSLSASENESPYARLERISNRETRKRFGKLGKQFVNLVKSIKSYLTLSFPSLHLALIGYMMVKFFVYEKTFEESKKIGEFVKVKLGHMVQAVRTKEEYVSQYHRGFECGAKELSNVFIRCFKKEIVRLYEDHLDSLETKDTKKEISANANQNDDVVEFDVDNVKEGDIVEVNNMGGKQNMENANNIDHNDVVKDDCDHTVPKDTEDTRQDQEKDKIIEKLLNENQLLKAHINEMETQMHNLRLNNEKLTDMCGIHSNRVFELEQELNSLRNNYTPPPATRTLSPLSPCISRPAPIGGHLKQYTSQSNVLSNPSIFSPWKPFT